MPRRRTRGRRGRPSAHLPSGHSPNSSNVQRAIGGPLVSTPQRTLGGFPDVVRTTLRYVEQQTLTSTSGVTGFYRYVGNDAYDPNYTGGGNQPANYDDWALHYTRYRVLASRITLVFLPVSGTVGTATMECVLYPSNSIDSSFTTNSAMAQPYSLFTMTSTTGPVTLVHSMTTKTAVGQNPRTADRLQAKYNTDPADIWLWNICYQTVDATTTASAYVKVVIDYDMEWFDRVSGDIDARLARLNELKQPFKSKRREPESPSCEIDTLPEVRQTAGGAFVLVPKEKMEKKKN